MPTGPNPIICSRSFSRFIIRLKQSLGVSQTDRRMDDTIVILSILAAGLGMTAWAFRSRRRREPGFDFVYVNQDGSVRELSLEERVYLSTELSGGDGARPYVKARYESRDGWGGAAGFIRRRQVPLRLTIEPVHPEFDARSKAQVHDFLGAHRAAGDDIVKNADGSITCNPNPALSRMQRFDLMRSHELAEQRRREALARIYRDQS